MGLELVTIVCAQDLWSKFKFKNFHYRSSCLYLTKFENLFYKYVLETDNSSTQTETFLDYYRVISLLQHFV